MAGNIAVQMEASLPASSKIIDGEMAITSSTDWQLMGGVVSSPAFFTPNLSQSLRKMSEQDSDYLLEEKLQLQQLHFQQDTLGVYPSVCIG